MLTNVHKINNFNKMIINLSNVYHNVKDNINIIVSKIIKNVFKVVEKINIYNNVTMIIVVHKLVILNICMFKNKYVLKAVLEILLKINKVIFAVIVANIIFQKIMKRYVCNLTVVLKIN